MAWFREHRLFIGCFIALIATAFGFQVRAQMMDTWQVEFELSETEKGEIFGAGLWPMAISIILFSLVVDFVGYGTAMIFAVICHVLQAVLLYRADGYTALYWGSILGALGNGTVEAVINPVVATLYPKEKTKWLAILHAGWPGGLVIAGMLFMTIPDSVTWQTQVLCCFVPIIAYSVVLLGQKFPIQERVQAGVSYKKMLQEPGIMSWVVVVALIVVELSRALHLSVPVSVMLFLVMVVPYAIYVRALGSWMFLVFVLVMMPLATTELGTDSWITPLMSGSFQEFGMDAGWVLVYTSFIMMMLRFFAGPIVHQLAPLSLLALSSGVAVLGLYSLGSVSGMGLIFGAATIYGLGKTFFWPAMLGVVSERFPQGGALTLNMVSGCGMLAVGILGAPWLGFVQDRGIQQTLEAKHSVIAEEVLEPSPEKFLGVVAYEKVKVAVEGVSAEQKSIVEEVQEGQKKSVLRTATILPIGMLVVYLWLIVYFKKQGGYQAVAILEEASPSG